MHDGAIQHAFNKIEVLLWPFKTPLTVLIVQFLLTEFLGVENETDTWRKDTRARISTFLTRSSEKYLRVGRHKQRFLTLYKEWLEKPLELEAEKKKKRPSVGAPKVKI